MPLSMQADAIRVALLQKYGGIWLDTDIILLNGEFIKEFNNYELTMIGEEKKKFQYIGFIIASNNSNILKEWLKQIINNVKNYKRSVKENNSTVLKNDSKINFDYLGNAIIDPLLKNSRFKNYLRVDSSKLNSFPERQFFLNSSMHNKQKYRLFYFERGSPQLILNNKKYVIYLHNSWTPKIYKNMSESEFLTQDIRLAKLFYKLLDLKASI